MNKVKNNILKNFFLILLISGMIILSGCTEKDQTANDTNTDTAPIDLPPTPSPPPSIQNTDTATIDLPPLPSPPPSIKTTPTATDKITTTELASHDTETDCWIAYEGKIYDVTNYIPIHPGGASQITPLCGTSDKFESAFAQQHGTSKVIILEKQGVYKGMLE